MSIERRLGQLEKMNPGEEKLPRSPEYVYEQIRRDAKGSIEESLREGDEPLYRIKDNGEVETADGRPINHMGDFIRALDERIAELDREIAEERRGDRWGA